MGDVRDTAFEVYLWGKASHAVLEALRVSAVAPLVRIREGSAGAALSVSLARTADEDARVPDAPLSIAALRLALASSRRTRGVPVMLQK